MEALLARTRSDPEQLRHGSRRRQQYGRRTRWTKSGGWGYVCIFWDTQTSGQATRGGGTGKTTAQMQSANMFAGWGYGNVWVLDEGHDIRGWHGRRRREAQSQHPFPAIFKERAATTVLTDPVSRTANTIGQFPVLWDKHLKLMANIDLSAYAWDSSNLIGINALPFTGVFDGNGHTVSNFKYNPVNRREPVFSDALMIPTPRSRTWDWSIPTCPGGVLTPAERWWAD